MRTFLARTNRSISLIAKRSRPRHPTAVRESAAHGLLFTRNDTLDLLEDDAMTATRGRIEHLVVRIQADFLDNPTLALTVPAAEKRFGLDEVACAGVLGALVEARVLTEARRDLSPVRSTTGGTAGCLNHRKAGAAIRARRPARRRL